MAVEISLADFTDPAVGQLVQSHAAYCNETAPPESCHHQPVEALDAPDIKLWTAAIDGETVGMGGLKALSPEAGEVKSMHTLAAARGHGVAKALLATITDEARARGYRSLSLETGAGPEFLAARRLYDGAGFRVCPPFGDYKADPLSAFLTLSLDGAAT